MPETDTSHDEALVQVETRPGASTGNGVPIGSRIPSRPADRVLDEPLLNEEGDD
jgi:hypothetical protein